jgi:hypothetical protein
MYVSALIIDPNGGSVVAFDRSECVCLCLCACVQLLQGKRAEGLNCRRDDVLENVLAAVVVANS